MRILLFALVLAAAALYIKIILPPDFDYAGLLAFDTEAPVAQQQPATAQPTTNSNNLRDMPQSQMQIIKDVFAPELRDR